MTTRHSWIRRGIGRALLRVSGTFHRLGIRIGGVQVVTNRRDSITPEQRSEGRRIYDRWQALAREEAAPLDRARVREELIPELRRIRDRQPRVNSQDA